MGCEKQTRSHYCNIRQKDNNHLPPLPPLSMEDHWKFQGGRGGGCSTATAFKGNYQDQLEFPEPGSKGSRMKILSFQGISIFSGTVHCNS